MQYRLQSWKHAMDKPLQKDAALRKSYDAGLALLELTCDSGEQSIVARRGWAELCSHEYFGNLMKQQLQEHFSKAVSGAGNKWANGLASK